MLRFGAMRVVRARWLLLVGCVALLLGGCGSSTNPDDATPSTDNPAELVAATVGDARVSLRYDGPLPEGIAAADLAIEPIEASAPPEGAAAGVAFALAPDGAQFESPVSVVVEQPGLDLPDLAALHLAADGTAEVIGAVAVDRDIERDTTRFTFEVSHFSEIHTFAPGKTGIETTILPPVPRDTYYVGERFTVTVQVDRVPLSEDYAWPERDVPAFHRVDVPGRDWAVRYGVRVYGLESPDTSPEDYGGGFGLIGGKSPISPDAVRDQLSFELVCRVPGPWVIVVNTAIVMTTETQYIPRDGAPYRGIEQHPVNAVNKLFGDCILDPNVTPTPPPTPDPLRGDPTGTPTGDGTATPTATATGTPPGVRFGDLPDHGIFATPMPELQDGVIPPPDPGYVVVFPKDGVWYDAAFLIAMDKHEPNCSYRHLHGGPMYSIVPVDGKTLEITEHLGDCGYGPVDSLFLIQDPR